jgi:hypothetical protein
MGIVITNQFPLRAGQGLFMSKGMTGYFETMKVKGIT